MLPWSSDLNEVRPAPLDRSRSADVAGACRDLAHAGSFRNESQPSRTNRTGTDPAHDPPWNRDVDIAVSSHHHRPALPKAGLGHANRARQSSDAWPGAV